MLAVDQLATELLSFHANLPSGSAIILIAVLIYVLSIALGPFGGLIWLVLPRRHLEA
jgi:zinc/manganese transport system permease protein